MRLRRLLVLVGAVVALLGAFVGGVVVGGHAEATGLTRLSEPLRGILLGESGESLPSQVLEVLEDGYYRPIDSRRLQSLSVDRMVEALGDPYTDYLSPEELDALRRSYDGAYYGVGIGAGARDGALVVTRVYDDSPAARAGIEEGDRIVSVDGRPTAGRDLQTVSSEIRGPEGTTVRLGVVSPDGARRDLELTRARVRAPAVESRVEVVDGTRIGYVHLSRFTRGAADDLRAAIEGLREKGVEALVLDLRGDPGGLVDEAIGVAGAFLPEDSPVVVTEGLHSPRKVYRTHDRPVAGDLPLIVLVNRGSASASEIVAGALRDAGRGRLVGERTFGKAVVQSTRPLRDGGALKLTTARYLTPDGFDLARRGLPPSVKVVDDPQTPRDEALQRALALAAAES